MADLSLRLRSLRPAAWLVHPADRLTLLGLLTRLALSAFLAATAYPTWALSAAPSLPWVGPSHSPPLQATEPYRVLNSPELSFLRDPEGRLGMGEVVSPALQDRFKPVGKGLRLSFTDDTVWLRVRLQRADEAPSDWRLELTATYLNDVLLFTPLPGGGFVSHQAGDQHPFAERQVLHRRPVFDVTLPDGEPRVLYLRLRSDSPLTLDLVVWQRGSFHAQSLVDTLWIGALLGIALIGALFFLHAWFINRDRRLLLTAAVSALFALTASSNLGLMSQSLLPQHPHLADGLHPFLMAAFFALLFSLFRLALDPRQTMRPFTHWHRVAAALCIVAACLRPLGWYGLVGGKLMMLGILSGLLWMVVLGWLLWRDGRSSLPLALTLTALAALFAAGPLMALDALPPTRHFELLWAASCMGFLWVAKLKVLAVVRQLRAQRWEARHHELEARDRKVRESLLRAQQAAYFAGVAHDVRTPLGALLAGLANLARLPMAAATGVRDELARMKGHSRRVADRISWHLEAQRAEQRFQAFKPALMPVADCLSRTLPMLADGLPGGRLQTRVQPDGPGLVAVDAELLALALLELVRHAADVLPANRAVVLHVAVQRDGLAFNVDDDGSGSAAMERVDWLRPPWQRPPQCHDAAEASGLAGWLWKVHRTAVIHGGWFAHRHAPGAAAGFTLWLPWAGGGLPEPAAPGRAELVSH